VEYLTKDANLQHHSKMKIIMIEARLTCQAILYDHKIVKYTNFNEVDSLVLDFLITWRNSTKSWRNSTTQI
jgi:hypothetical protein